MEKKQCHALDGYMRSGAKPLTEIREQLFQIDRLTTLGKMALSIVHEINNSLAAIQEQAGWMGDLLADESDKGGNPDEYRTSVLKIEKHVEQMRKIIHRAVGFARPADLQTSCLKIERVINDAVALLENRAGMEHITIRKNFQAELPEVQSDDTGLQQVFLNIMENAIDAMPRGGELIIASKAAEERIEISFKDTGDGIPADRIETVFEPFFSTKTKSNGTGLGLPISRDIIRELGGDITVHSIPGRFTTFTVSLPACTRSS